MIPTITVFQNFLPVHLYSELHNWAIANRDKFQSSNTTDNKEDWRSSTVCFDFPFSLMQMELGQILEPALQSLSMLPFPIEGVEFQMTASGDGDFYKLHRDNGDESCANRILTFCYYCSRSPIPFTGGELVVHGHERVVVQPEPNSLVIFASSHEHEVLSVSSSGQWEDSRFTVNGWFRAKPLVIPPMPDELLTQQPGDFTPPVLPVPG